LRNGCARIDGGVRIDGGSGGSGPASEGGSGDGGVRRRAALGADALGRTAKKKKKDAGSGRTCEGEAAARSGEKKWTSFFFCLNFVLFRSRDL
jgi:hypothetical protein